MYCLLLGNPKAVQEKKRFLDINLNRIFTRQFIDPQLRKDMLRTGNSSCDSKQKNTMKRHV